MGSTLLLLVTIWVSDHTSDCYMGVPYIPHRNMKSNIIDSHLNPKLTFTPFDMNDIISEKDITEEINNLNTEKKRRIRKKLNVLSRKSIENEHKKKDNKQRRKFGTTSLRSGRPQRKLKDMRLGDEFAGKVKSITPYGAFINIGSKNDALLHISRISFDKISNIHDYLNIGDKVSVHVIGIDRVKKRMAVSMLPRTADKYLDRRKENRKVV